MTRYVAERHAGAWQVRDTISGETVAYGAGARGAAAAGAGAERLNRTSESKPGNAVRAWRTAHGLSQTKLAELLGVAWLTVQRWESGVQSPPPFLFRALNDLDRELASA